MLIRTRRPACCSQGSRQSKDALARCRIKHSTAPVASAMMNNVLLTPKLRFLRILSLCETKNRRRNLIEELRRYALEAAT